MAAFDLPQIDYKTPLVDPATGTLSRYGYALFNAIINRLGGSGSFDKVDAAHTIATAAVPQGTEVVAGGGLKIGGALGGNVAVALYITRTAVASLPTVAISEGDWAYAIDGLKPGETTGAGTGVPCFRSAGAWVSACDGAAVAA